MSIIKCYISYSGFQEHHGYLTRLLENMEKSFYSFSRRYPGNNIYDKDTSLRLINEVDIFIIFGTKSYFSSVIAIMELEIAIQSNKKILFLNSSEIKTLVSYYGFNETEEIKKAKYWIGIMKKQQQFYLSDDVIRYGFWHDTEVNGIKQSISKLMGIKKKLVYISFDESYNFNYIGQLPGCLNPGVYSFVSRLDKTLPYAVINDKLHFEIKILIESSDNPCICD